MAEIEGFRLDIENGKNPRDIKFLLGEELVARFHSAAKARNARDQFVARFQKGAMPDEIEEKSISAPDGEIGIANLLKEAGLTPSTSEAIRMIKQGAVKIDGERVEDARLALSAGTTNIYQVGKRRFAKVTLF